MVGAAPDVALLTIDRTNVLPLIETICGCCVCTIGVARGTVVLSTGNVVALIVFGGNTLLAVVACTTMG